MASTFRKLAGDIEGDLEDQVARLTKEIAALKKLAAKRGSAVYEDTRDQAADLYGELWDRFNESIPVLRKRARSVEKVARDNPATAAVVGLAVVGLLVTLLARK